MNITEMSDDWIDRLIQRYRDELDAIDRVDASEYVAMANQRHFLRSQIRLLTGGEGTQESLKRATRPRRASLIKAVEKGGSSRAKQSRLSEAKPSAEQRSGAQQSRRGLAQRSAGVAQPSEAKQSRRSGRRPAGILNQSAAPVDRRDEDITIRLR